MHKTVILVAENNLYERRSGALPDKEQMTSRVTLRHGAGVVANTWRGDIIDKGIQKSCFVMLSMRLALLGLRFALLSLRLTLFSLRLALLK